MLLPRPPFHHQFVYLRDGQHTGVYSPVSYYVGQVTIFQTNVNLKMDLSKYFDFRPEID